MQQSKKVGSF